MPYHPLQFPNELEATHSLIRHHIDDNELPIIAKIGCAAPHLLLLKVEQAKIVSAVSLDRQQQQECMIAMPVANLKFCNVSKIVSYPRSLHTFLQLVGEWWGASTLQPIAAGNRWRHVTPLLRREIRIRNKLRRPVEHVGTCQCVVDTDKIITRAGWDRRIIGLQLLSP
ncbi:hypothetical protein LSTR_LSTR009060 [Laodelphax striatellus]|uniref:Uncharacterized protein n=1 Tax=Laodelphax striatellus TaxID=195883 RepID=A0A482WJB7_LAOST|nr:hypothetical protein LSTR_LSTR009060 [Laodelphax striatellus]